MTGSLFDENLPRRTKFRPTFPIVHASALGESPSDLQMWAYAAANRLAIVSKDGDFSDRAMGAAPPPWVVHLRFGNMRLAAFYAMLEKVWPAVESLLPAHKLICVYQDRIESFRG